VDFLIPNTDQARQRLEELLVGEKWEKRGNDYVMTESLARKMSDRLDREDHDCDWGTYSE
jgi:hypothetical protein